MKYLKALIPVLCAVMVLASGCHRVSPEEKALAQKMFNWGIDASSGELAQVKKPSTFFPFLMGLVLLSEEKYDLAHEQFTALSKKYPESKVAAYYAALSELGTQHKVVLPQLVHDFYEQLYGAKDTSYFYGKPDEATTDFEARDPMFGKFKEGVLLKEARSDPTGFTQGVDKWFASLKDKRPYDYIIYSMLTGRIGDLPEGLERYPDNRPLIERFVTMAFITKDKGQREGARALIDKLVSDPYFALLKVAGTCEENQSEWVEHWGGVLRSPLCPEQVNLMESISWDKSSYSGNVDEEIRKYYRENVAPKLQSELSALPYIHSTTAAFTLYDLAGRISASAFKAYKKKDYDLASHYLAWNKYVYRALGEKGHETFISKIIQLSIAEAMFKGTHDLSTAEGNETAAKDYADKYEEVERLLRFYVDYVKAGPYMWTAGLPRMMSYEEFEAQRPIWLDRVFAGQN